jgi:hypothetical protein
MRINDPEGEEFETLADARQDAIEGIRQMLANEVLNGQVPVTAHRSIEICDATGRVLDVVTFEEALRGRAPLLKPAPM